MPTHSMIRLSAILSTFLLAVAMSGHNKAWLTFVYGLGFVHYFMSYFYSRQKIIQVVSNPSSRLSFGIVLLMGAFGYLVRFPLNIYFGFHHAFNEAYLLDRTVPPEKVQEIRGLRTAGVFVNFFIYFFLLRNVGELSFLSPDVFFLGTAVSYAAFFYFLYRSSAFLNLREMIDNSFLEILSLGVLAASFFMKIRFTHLIFFHLIFWTFYPLPKLIQAGRPDLIRYVGGTILMLIPVFLLSPFGIHPYELKGSLFAEQFYSWSYLHITTSFALSTAHPRWITKWFIPREVPVPITTR